MTTDIEHSSTPPRNRLNLDSLLIEASERGYVPDALLRLGIRRLLAQRLNQEGATNPAHYESRKAQLVQQLRTSPLALATDTANSQHYEVPSAFYQHCLGPHLKYSSSYWPEGVNNLADAESRMLALTCERAELADGQRILELGCGWGSLSLWMASHYPKARIVAVSNSRTQKTFIDAQAAARGLNNLEIVTADMNYFDTAARFDRVVSVEMFEHMRNYAELLRRISRWLTPNGRLFVHIFCHKDIAYPFEAKADDDWMARHFFTGGVMPSFDLLLHFPEHVNLVQRWWVSGSHYARSCEAWLDRCDTDIPAVRHSLQGGQDTPERLRQRWRMFFMACAELFAYREGREWGVGHYLFRPQAN